MPTPRGGAVALLAIAAVTPTAPAHAAETAAFLRIDLFGATDPQRDLDKDIRNALSDQLSLASVGHVQEVLAGHPELASCTTTDCVKRLGALLEARFLVRGEIRQVSKDVTGALDLYDASTGQHIDSAPMSCDLCAWSEVRQNVTDAAKKLAQRAASEKRIVVPPPTQPPPQPPLVPTGPPPGLGLKVAGGVALVAAIGLIATGAVMMAYDGRCSITIPPEASPEAICPRPYDTMLEGGLFIGGGALMAAASTGLFVAGTRAARVVPSVSGSRDGAMFSLRLSY